MDGQKGKWHNDWKSSVPKQVAQNTTEAEMQSAIECVKDVVYTRVLLEELGYKQEGSTRVYIDSNAAMSQVNATKGTRAVRHYIVALRKVQELRHLGIIHTQRVDTKDNVADLFTKAVEPGTFWRLSTKAMGDALALHAYADYRDGMRHKEITGGRIKDLNVELRAREKNRKAEYKKLKEETDNENRELKRAQSAALTAQTTALLAISDKLMKQEKD